MFRNINARLQTAVIVTFGWLSLNFNPAEIRKNYMPAYQTEFSPLAARSVGAWFLLSAIVRYGAWRHWGEKGWYDAGMASLALPLWHYSVEAVWWGSVTWKQIFLAYSIDGIGLVWMYAARGSVLRG